MDIQPQNNNLPVVPQVTVPYQRWSKSAIALFVISSAILLFLLYAYLYRLDPYYVGRSYGWQEKTYGNNLFWGVIVLIPVSLIMAILSIIGIVEVHSQKLKGKFFVYFSLIVSTWPIWVLINFILSMRSWGGVHDF